MVTVWSRLGNYCDMLHTFNPTLSRCWLDSTPTSSMCGLSCSLYYITWLWQSIKTLHRTGASQHDSSTIEPSKYLTTWEREWAETDELLLVESENIQSWHPTSLILSLYKQILSMMLWSQESRHGGLTLDHTHRWDSFCLLSCCPCEPSILISANEMNTYPLYLWPVLMRTTHCQCTVGVCVC